MDETLSQRVRGKKTGNWSHWKTGFKGNVANQQWNTVGKNR